MAQYKGVDGNGGWATAGGGVATNAGPTGITVTYPGGGSAVPVTTSPIPQVSTTTASNVPKQAQATAIQAKTALLTDPAKIGISTAPNGGLVHANGTAYTPQETQQAADIQSQIDKLTQQVKTQQEGINNGTIDENGNPIVKPTQITTYPDYWGNTVALPLGYTLPTGVTITPGSNGNYIGSDGKQYAKPTGDTSYYDQQIMNNLNQIKANSDSAMATAVDGITKSYDNYIQQQQEINRQQEAGTMNALLMGGVTGAGSSSQYAPISSQGIMTAQINYGIQQIRKLQNERDGLISVARLQDYSSAQGNRALQAINDQLEKNRTEQVNAAIKLNDIVNKQNETLTDNVMQSKRDNAIANIIVPTDGSTGTIEPTAILQKLKSAGDTTTTLSDISNVLKTIATSTGGTTGSVSNGVEAFWNLKNQKGGLPADILMLPDTSSQLFAFLQRYNGANSKSTSTGASGSGGTSGTTSTSTSPIDPETGVVSKSILAATGLSMPAFMFLTTGTSALTRMTAAQRLQYMNEAEKYVNKTGTDVATFRSQYSALSKTVEANLLRNNQAGVAESELDATIKNIASASTSANLGNLSKLNTAKIWAGKQLNDANATTFKFHLEQLRREFAMYNAAIEGQIDANGNIRQITDADLKRADDIINEGFAKGSIAGFETALTNSRAKMKVVLENSINTQNKQVWKLFGIENKYQAPGTSLGGSSLEDMANTPLPGDSTYNPSDTSIWDTNK